MCSYAGLRFGDCDAPGFFREIAKDQDRRRICGFSPLYSLIHLLEGGRGRNLKYTQALTPETGSAVTFTSRSSNSGLLLELETQVFLCRRLKYLETADADALLSEIEEISKMLGSLISKIH